MCKLEKMLLYQKSIFLSFRRCLVGLLFLSSLFLSCKQEHGSTDFLPSAKGGRGELILVMDSAKWQGALGDAIRDLLMPPSVGLPRPQPLFTVRYIRPDLFSGLLKQHFNIVEVTTFDSKSYHSKLLQAHFTPESAEKVRRGEQFQQLKRNEYAKGQIVLRLFAAKEAELIAYLKKEQDNLRKIFSEEERKRVKAKLLSVKGNTLAQEKMEAAHGFSTHLPEGFRTVRDTAGFLWFRHPEAKIDRSLFFAYQDYKSEAQFEAAYLVSWRDSLMKQHVYGDPKNSQSYVLTEPLEPVHTAAVNLEGRYALELRGRWKTKNLSMGGPFVAYALLDKTKKRLCYIEGMLYSPDVKQREILRRLEVILRTFR